MRIDRGAGIGVAVTVEHDLATFGERLVRVYDYAVYAGVADAGEIVKRNFRRQIIAAGLGRRLANTVRDITYPDRLNASVNAAVVVESRAPKIVGAHERGALIRSASGFYLAIPTDAAGRGARGARLTPGEWEARRGIRLRFVYRKRGHSLLVADNARVNTRGVGVASRSKTGRGVATVPIFILVPQVRLRKRIDIKTAADVGLAALPRLISGHARKLAQRGG